MLWEESAKMRLMKVSVIALVIVTAIFGSSSAEAASVSFETPGTLIGSFNTDLIHESSGLAASRQNANVLYTHNDSGDIARFFAVNTSGNLLGIYQLDGATATDWEDMAVGPGPVAGVNYVYLGDIGDNSSNRNGTTRPNVAIYRTPEPTVSNPPTLQIQRLLPLSTSVRPTGKKSFCNTPAGRQTVKR